MNYSLENVRGAIIGESPRRIGGLHQYSDGVRVSPPFYGDSDEEVRALALTWYHGNDGKDRWPNGLELRVWD